MSLKLMSAIIPASSPSMQFDDSKKILNQLLEYVQQCQKRYGGKTELATEFDSCVAGLCLSLEAILSHGLRSKPLESQQSSTLKQVSDIVASSLHSKDSPPFWTFVKNHLTKHEQERYMILKHIWTDTGRGRAWIRSALNECSLERYLHTLLSNTELLKRYYESWALLCDEEKNSMLPNMAAGLGSILFAVSIDKPELNSSNSGNKLNKLKTQPEPIIDVPVTMTDKMDHKKKRKVAKNVISFEEDDSILSSSIPSSSSSITSETNSSHETQWSYQSQKNKKITSKKSMQNVDNKNSSSSDSKKEKLKLRLSIEKSGMREKFVGNLDGTLTPVEQTNIGELTPVSVEINPNTESPNTSDNIEIPSDISAVLTAVEVKNKEEVEKLQNTIETLSKDNDSLKDQLKTYVTAVQMLKKDDVNLQKALEGLQIDQQPDYKHEAKMFEKKLVQVAEMHAELMDFNVLLQKALCEKDTILERLKSELEELRGPLPSDNLSEELQSSVHVWIPSAFLTGSGSDAHHVYQIFLRAGNDEWNIYRRYAQFYALHTDLKKLDPVLSSFDFPPKKSLGRKEASLVENRRKRLQTYLRRIIAHWPELAHCNNRYLLETHLAFFKDQHSNETKSKRESRRNLFTPRRSVNIVNDNHYTGL